VFLPAYDYQRTYEPFTDMVRHEVQQGRRIALAGDQERDCGAFMFYLNSRLKQVELGDGSECGRFFDGEPGPAGIIISKRDLGQLASLLSSRSLRMLTCNHGGYKSAEFRLLINDPVPGNEIK